ncbi:MAG: acyl-CoA dehydratase activase, partial [Candidatus Omnitrophica bacterium]|nr:acyl-CoA dehydratase activase [Candidatus Omnitrophota bacterium]
MGSIKTQCQAERIEISGVGITGSGRKLASLLIGADVVRNEVTAQTLAALKLRPDVRSVIEIGGQDSKVIILENGVPLWHNLNNLCAAGTGSFLSSQAYRLKVPVEELGDYAARSTRDVVISAKCAVFSESDMVHKAALGYKKEDIIKGLCEGLARNFINNVARNRPIESPTLFVGGVAANGGVVRALEKELGHAVIVPEEHKITGCIGAALLALKAEIKKTKFLGLDCVDGELRSESFVCEDCSNHCEIARFYTNGEACGHLNSRCGKWDGLR